MKYITDIGLEVHVELATKSKIFCGCNTEFGGEPNTHTCPVCMGMPGTLPVLNKKVVEYAVAVGLATNCQINQVNRFDRKNYYYPDNPQNYQISQLYTPICRDGYIDIEVDNNAKRIGIHEIHMEEDAGKLIHDDNNGVSKIDYNRAGVPLIEIVTKPHMNSGQEVVDFLEKLRLIIQYLGASDCKLNEGSMRVDVNLSVRDENSNMLGTRTEMKNLNSFRAIMRAIEHERDRQIDIIEKGGNIDMETRRWDDTKGESYLMRSKEEAKDYRYFPEPDLKAVYISDEWIKEIRSRRPELRDEKIKRYIEEYQITEYDAEIITLDLAMTKLFEETVAICGRAKKVSNWLITETMRILKENSMEISASCMSASNFAKLVTLADDGIVNSTVAKQIFEQVFMKNVDPIEYMEEHGLKQDNDEAGIRAVVEQVLSENEKSVNDYKNGKDKAIGYLVGQTMRATKGKANPEIINRILLEILKS